MIRSIMLGLSAGWWMSFATSAQAAKPMIELTVGDRTYAGRAVAHDKKTCWLLESDGRLQELDLGDVSKFRKLPTKFSSMKGVDVRNQLQKEVGHHLDVISTEHYVVCADKGQARRYAALFEQTYRDCRHYFQVRGLKIEPSEFPLVGIVFPTRQEFADYMAQDGSHYAPGLMGYYSPKTNRCVLYEHAATTAMNDGVREFDLSMLAARSHDPFADDLLIKRDGMPRIYFRGGDDASVQDTIIHEGMHQVAFNIGVHSRCGQNPRWVVEGLATVFEAPGIRERSSSIQARLNHERFIWFGDYLKNRRQKKSFSTFIGGDTMFQVATLDAYAQSWALTFYLLETRSSQYAKYLKRLSERDPLTNVTAKDRIADFQTEFGKDIDWLEIEMERFFVKLN